MAQEAPLDVIKRYLEDAIAAEKNFESQLRANAKEGDQTAVQAVFAQHADETRRQWERLEARLNSLGGSESRLKSAMAHVFGFAPKLGQLGHADEERNTQDLFMAYAIENAEVAMYEALATVAAAAGDNETERLARDIQAEERQAAQKVWNLVAPSARDAFQQITSGVRV